MNWRLLCILISLSGCASTVWKNDQEQPPVRYTDQLVSYEVLTEELILTLKKHISQQLLELIDHSSNASNEAYSATLRAFSKEQVRTIMNLNNHKTTLRKVDKIISQVRKTSFEQFLIKTPEIENDSTLYSDISIDGKDFIKARIKRNLKVFSPDTLKVWEVDFMYLKSGDY